MKKIIGRKKKKGFTLMELLVSLGIVAALSMMVAPMIMGKVDEAKKKADISNANAIAVAVKSEMIENSTMVGEIKSGTYSNFANKYFDGQLPTPRSVGGQFTITIEGTKVIVAVDSTNYYPADPSLLAENNE